MFVWNRQRSGQKDFTAAAFGHGAGALFPLSIHGFQWIFKQNSRGFSKQRHALRRHPCRIGLKRGCRVMTLFRPVSPKKYLPQNSVLFSMDSSAGDDFFIAHSVFGRQNPLLLISEALFFLYGFFPGFPFEFMYFIMQKTVVFIFRPIAYSINSL